MSVLDRPTAAPEQLEAARAAARALWRAHPEIRTWPPLDAISLWEERPRGAEGRAAANRAEREDRDQRVAWKREWWRLQQQAAGCA